MAHANSVHRQTFWRLFLFSLIGMLPFESIVTSRSVIRFYISCFLMSKENLHLFNLLYLKYSFDSVFVSTVP